MPAFLDRQQHSSAEPGDFGITRESLPYTLDKGRRGRDVQIPESSAPRKNRRRGTAEGTEQTRCPKTVRL